MRPENSTHMDATVHILFKTVKFNAVIYQDPESPSSESGVNRETDSAWHAEF